MLEDDHKIDSTHTTIHVFDNFVGYEMRVEATKEGLEFETGSTITWEWIDNARKAWGRFKSATCQVADGNDLCGLPTVRVFPIPTHSGSIENLALCERHSAQYPPPLFNS
jgi:hypothetical protein